MYLLHCQVYILNTILDNAHLNVLYCIHRQAQRAQAKQKEAQVLVTPRLTVSTLASQERFQQCKF
jgi:hypothetical protein